MISSDGSRTTALAPEHGPSSTDISSSEELLRTCQPSSSAVLNQWYISASSSPLKTGKMLPPSSVNTSMLLVSPLVISHHGDRSGLPFHSHVLS